MHLGLTRSQIRHVWAVGAGLGAIALVVGGVGVWAQGGLRNLGEWAFLLAGCTVLAAVVPVAVIAASVLQLDIDGQTVRQTLFGRWVVSQRPLSELAAVYVQGRAFPVVLEFRDGSRMRVIGAPLGQISAFVNELRHVAPSVRLDT